MVACVSLVVGRCKRCVEVGDRNESRVRNSGNLSEGIFHETDIFKECDVSRYREIGSLLNTGALP